MTRKVYRTAQGKMVDLGALQLRNENVRAVGNMKVNARGDLIDSANRAIDTRNRQVARQYRKQTGNTTDQPVVASQAHSTTVQSRPQPQTDQGSGTASQPIKSKKIAKQPPTVPEGVDPSVDVSVAAPAPPKTPAAGLAAAIARAREIRQDPLTTHNSVAQHQNDTTKS